jgi:pimeloyl-ACP methyl ester carboxylesterase
LRRHLGPAYDAPGASGDIPRGSCADSAGWRAATPTTEVDLRSLWEDVTMPVPEFTRLDVPGRPTGVALLLHGGKADGHDPVDDSSVSWRRSRWMMREIADRAHAEGVSLWLLRYLHRGWNEGSGAVPSPVPDARWALSQIRGVLGELPVVLLGHSMGARTAVAVADHPSVTGVVALAPWLPAGEPVEPLRGKPFAAAQGRADLITSFRATEAFALRAGNVAASVEMHHMGRVGHYMLRRRREWNDFAVTRTLAFIRQHAERGDDAPTEG